MIDTLRRYETRARARSVPERFGLRPGRYAVCTLHRPSNVDDGKVLQSLLQVLARLQNECEIVFPMHPRTRARIEDYGLGESLASLERLHAIEPLNYLDFLGLLADAALVLTDSGGIQEETTALGIPCLTIRERTERPITVTQGTNTVVGTDPERIFQTTTRALSGDWQRGSIPERWDGHAAKQIAEILCAQKPSLAPREEG